MWRVSYWRARAKIIETGCKLETMSTRDPRHEVIWLVENGEREWMWLDKKLFYRNYTIVFIYSVYWN